MAQMLKYHNWNTLPTLKWGNKMKYPLHEWFNGYTWKLERGIDFDGDTIEFRKYLFTVARNKDFWIQTAIHANGRDFFMKHIRPKGEPWKRTLEEWEFRWVWQRAWTSVNWWESDDPKGIFDEFRAVRQFQKLRHKKTDQYRLAMMLEMLYRMDETDKALPSVADMVETVESYPLPESFIYFHEADIEEQALAYEFAEYSRSKTSYSDKAREEYLERMFDKARDLREKGLDSRYARRKDLGKRGKS